MPPTKFPKARLLPFLLRKPASNNNAIILLMVLNIRRENQVVSLPLFLEGFIAPSQVVFLATLLLLFRTLPHFFKLMAQYRQYQASLFVAAPSQFESLGTAAVGSLQSACRIWTAMWHRADSPQPGVLPGDRWLGNCKGHALIVCFGPVASVIYPSFQWRHRTAIGVNWFRSSTNRWGRNAKRQPKQPSTKRPWVHLSDPAGSIERFSFWRLESEGSDSGNLRGSP